jgi:hypothetical protein
MTVYGGRDPDGRRQPAGVTDDFAIRKQQRRCTGSEGDNPVGPSVLLI